MRECSDPLSLPPNGALLIDYSDDDRVAIDSALAGGRTVEAILRNVDETLETAMSGLELVAEDKYVFNGPIDFVGVEPSDFTTSDVLVPNEQMVRAMAFPLAKQQRKGIRIAITFGVATSHALQNLRHKAANFDDWWASKSQSLSSDPLARYFYKMRSVLLKEGYLKATTANQRYRIEDGVNWIEVQTYFYGAPTEHRGVDISGKTCAELLEVYLSFMGEIVAEAWDLFSPNTESLRMPTPVVSGSTRTTVRFE